jgi:hypothetical protein
VLIILQISIAKKWLPLRFKWHRRNGWLILIMGAVHGTLAIAAYVFHVPVQGF